MMYARMKEAGGGGVVLSVHVLSIPQRLEE